MLDAEIQEALELASTGQLIQELTGRETFKGVLMFMNQTFRGQHSTQEPWHWIFKNMNTPQMVGIVHQILSHIIHTEGPEDAE